MDEIKQEQIIQKLDSMMAKVQNAEVLEDMKSLRAQLNINTCKDADMNGNGPAVKSQPAEIIPVNKDELKSKSKDAPSLIR